MTVRFSTQVKNDLKTIKAYIGRDSVYYASVVVQKIIERTEVLQKHPESGRVILKTPTTVLRQLLLYKYRLIYRIVNDTVEVLTVHHSAKLLDDNPGISPYFDEQ